MTDRKTPRRPPVPGLSPAAECDLIMKGGITSGVVYPWLVARLAGRYRFRQIGGSSAGAMAAAACAAAEFARRNGSVGGFTDLIALPEDLGQRQGMNGPTLLRRLFVATPALRRHFDALLGLINQANRGGNKNAPGEEHAAMPLLWLLASRGWWRLLLVGMIVVVLIGLLMSRGGAASAWCAGGAAVVGVILSLGIGGALFWLAARLDRLPQTTTKVLTAWWATSAFLLAGLCSAVSRAPPGFSDVLAGAVGSAAIALATVSVLVWCGYAFVRELLDGLKSNHWGLCSGHGDDVSVPALTDWLADTLDRIALRGNPDQDGRDGAPGATRTADRPLILADLWAGRFQPDVPRVAGDVPACDRVIDLEVLTTALSLHIPYALPMRPQEGAFFCFDPTEWEKLFPGRVMRWLKKAGQPLEIAGRTYYPLPANRDLPVVVMARMSLSFPVLLSAVPMYLVTRREPREAPGKVWFSDGGIASNMPLHFFDAPVPDRPTFAVDLVDSDKNRRRVRLPKKVDPLGTRLRAPKDDGPAVKGLAAFLWRIVETMHSWRDEMQLHTPGYSERVVRILQRPGEGGLNLDMDGDKIRALARAGDNAAKSLIARFGAPPRDVGPGWREHQLHRLRNFLALAEGVGRHTNLREPVWRKLVLEETALFPGDARQVALDALALLQAIGPATERPSELVLTTEDPRPVARIMPRI